MCTFSKGVSVTGVSGAVLGRRCRYKSPMPAAQLVREVAAVMQEFTQSGGVPAADPRRTG